MNKVAMIGRLTKDVESRQANNGTLIANISIAVDRRFKREGQPEADFFNCTAFGKTAEFIEKYFSKGMKIALSGSLQNDTYEKDGTKHTITKIMIDEVEFCEKKTDTKTGEKVDANGFMNIPNGLDDELPFN